MDRLEQYIKDNLESFDSAIPSAGSRGRFIEAVEKENSGKRKVLWFSVAGSAAAAVAAILLTIGLSSTESIELKKNFNTLASLEAQIIDLAERNYPEEHQSVISSIRSITSQAIPLEDQLPPELNAEERIEILKQYYGKQVEALSMLLAEYESL